MGASDQLRIDVRRASDRLIVTLDGELDLASAPLLQQAIDGADPDSVEMLVFDLQQLKFMDSTGLRTILSSRERCQQRGQQFAVTPGSEQVQRLLSVTGAAGHLRTIAAVDEIVV
jgi:anti-sigma B factor antagonist